MLHLRISFLMDYEMEDSYDPVRKTYELELIFMIKFTKILIRRFWERISDSSSHTIPELHSPSLSVESFSS